MSTKKRWNRNVKNITILRLMKIQNYASQKNSISWPEGKFLESGCLNCSKWPLRKVLFLKMPSEFMWKLYSITPYISTPSISTCKHMCLYADDIYQSVMKSLRSKITVILLILSQITVKQAAFLIKLQFLSPRSV